MIYATPRPEDPSRQTTGGVNLNPGFLQTLGTEAAQQFSGFTSLGALNTLSHEPVMAHGGLTQDQWEHSQWYRKGIKYHKGMTSEDAQYLAHAHDVSKQRQFLLSQSDHWGAKLLGTVVGSIPDPLNFVGVGELGDAVRGLDMLSHSPMLAHVASGAASAGVAVGAAQPLVVASQHDIGNDYDWRDALGTTLAAATIGAGAGALAHVLHQVPIEDRVKGTQVAAAQLSNDEPVNVAPYIRSVGERVDIKPTLFKVAGETVDHSEDQALAERVVHAQSKPGFLRTPEDNVLLKHVDLTPDQERAIHIMSKPGFMHTSEDKTFLRAFKNGTTTAHHEAAIKAAKKVVHSKANYVTRMDAAAKADEAQKSIDINNAPSVSHYAPEPTVFKPTSEIDHSDQFFNDMAKAGTLPEEDQAAYEQAVKDETMAQTRAAAYRSAASCI